MKPIASYTKEIRDFFYTSKLSVRLPSLIDQNPANLWLFKVAHILSKYHLQTRHILFITAVFSIIFNRILDTVVQTGSNLTLRLEVLKWLWFLWYWLQFFLCKPKEHCRIVFKNTLKSVVYLVHNVEETTYCGSTTPYW